MLPWTAEDIYWVVMITTVFLAAQPTPTVATLSTGHVVAPRDLLKPDLAFRAVTNAPIICSPFEEVLVKYVLAIGFSMPFHPTVEANFLAALTLCPLLFVPFYVVIAVRSRTPL